jgi:four helix bundle protein
MRRYLDIALGSMAEVTYQLILARDLGYLTATQYDELEALRNRAGKLLWGLSQTAMQRGKR